MMKTGSFSPVFILRRLLSFLEPSQGAAVVVRGQLGVAVWSRAVLGVDLARRANHSLINIHDSSHLAAALGTGAALLLVLGPWRALSKAEQVLSWAGCCRPAAPPGHPTVVLSSSCGMPGPV